MRHKETRKMNENPTTEMNWELSFCGLNCLACEIYHASHGNSELHESLVKFFKENFDPNITVVSCEKCRGIPDKCWTPDCYFRSCATNQGFSYCFECKDFVCDKLIDFGNQAPHHAKTIDNMKKMKELGVDKWLVSQKEVQFCP